MQPTRCLFVARSTFTIFINLQHNVSALSLAVEERNITLVARKRKRIGAARKLNSPDKLCSKLNNRLQCMCTLISFVLKRLKDCDAPSLIIAQVKLLHELGANSTLAETVMYSISSDPQRSQKI